MSINWVMLSSSQDFHLLPSEQKLYTSPNRVSISLDSMNKYPGRQPYHLSCDAGRVHLTNRRIVYIPTTPPAQTSNQAPPTVLASFTAPLANLHDTRVTTPWLGPNAWVAAVQPVYGGGIPTHHAAVELRMVFKDGGAYDFHTRFCELRERLAQARETAAASNGGVAGGRGAAEQDVHLEQLPAYEESGGIPAPQASRNDDSSVTADSGQQGANLTRRQPYSVTDQAHVAPSEPPPGYEEVQRDSVAELLDSQLRIRNS